MIEKNDTEFYENVDFAEIDDDLAAFQEDEMVQHALQRGVDLKKYAIDLERDLRQAESDAVEQFVTHNSKFSNLHNELQRCDQTLGRMEEMLRGFQADLGEISSEIKHLQDDSLFMNVKLKNRRLVEEKVNKFLERSAIPASISQNIMSPYINEAFLESVVTLADRLKYLELDKPATDGSSLTIAPASTITSQQLLPELEKLKIKAITKIKDYLTNQIATLRKPKTNVQVLQQNSLLKYAALFHFLQDEVPAIAEDIRGIYIEAMSKTLLNLFKSYFTQLLKFELICTSKNDLIVCEEAVLKSLFLNKLDPNKRADAFSLTGRDKVLEEIEADPLLLHVVSAENRKFPFEVLMRSVLKHLVDAASNEFLFIIEFFKVSPKETFNRVFGKTISFLLESIENYLLNCFDGIGILILIKLSYQLRLVMQRRRVPVLDPFFDRLSLLLWPRFKNVFDANLKSVKHAIVKKLFPIDCSAHYVTRRYSEFISSVIVLACQNSSNTPPTDPTFGNESLGVGGGGESMIYQDVQLLRGEVLGLLQKMGDTLPAEKERKVFLINNFDLVISLFQEKQIISEELSKFEELLMQQREMFAEEEIKTYFPRLIHFVVEHEMRAASSSNSPGADPAMESLVKEFSANWKLGIQQINDEVLFFFANSSSAMEILKQVLTQLLLYYTRFQDIIKQAFHHRPPPFARDIVSTATILMEIKRYSRTF